MLLQLPPLEVGRFLRVSEENKGKTVMERSVFPPACLSKTSR